MQRHDYLSLLEAIMEHQITLQAMNAHLVIDNTEYRQESERLRDYKARVERLWKIEQHIV